jgi:mannose-1-phosphate guanylyltransferase
VGIFPYENILVVTSAQYAEQIAKTLPQLPAQNIIGEPEGRDTANAIALAAELLAGRDENATMAVFTADHVIRPVECFAEAVKKACDVAESHPQALLTFGVKPNWPHTGLGYIHCTSPLSDGVHKVIGFKEKPDHQTARRYVESGQYFWNSGMFVWTLGAIRAAVKEFLPESARQLAGISEAVRAGGDYQNQLDQTYPRLERISIDYAVMEKAQTVLMVELNCQWLDVGNWPSLENVSNLDEAGNVVVAANAVLQDSFRNIIVSEDGHLLAVLGIDDCVIVHSADATLVCNKADALRLKELLILIEQKYGKKYL